MLQAQPLSLRSFSTKDQPLLHFLCTHTGKDSTKASPTHGDLGYPASRVEDNGFPPSIQIKMLTLFHC